MDDKKMGSAAGVESPNPVAGTKDDLLGIALDRTPLVIGGKAYIVRGLTAEEETKIGNAVSDEVEKKRLNAVLVSLVLETPEGNRVFSKEDVPTIQKMPGKIVREIVTAAMKTSGLDEESRKQLGKASGGAEGADSSSA